MIKFSDVNKTFKTKDSGTIIALDNVNLEVAKKDIYGIIGTSGAGKSTLLRMVNKLESADSGDVIVNNANINKLDHVELKALRHSIGMIFQHFNLLASLTVYQNIIFPLKLSGQLSKLSQTALESRTASILELTGLKHLINQYPHQLSGGQKQRVAIARSLITEPDILLCDECTSALDPETTETILKLLAKINSELGVTILLITHEMEVIKTLCHKVAVMSHGKIIESGSVLKLYSNPSNEITKNILFKPLKTRLPQFILDKAVLEKNKLPGMIPLVQLTFKDKAAIQPVLSNLLHQYNANFNILQGDIETIQNTIVGKILLQLESDEPTLQEIKNLLNRQDISFEIIAYVPRITE